MFESYFFIFPHSLKSLVLSLSLHSYSLKNTRRFLHLLIIFYFFLLFIFLLFNILRTESAFVPVTVQLSHLCFITSILYKSFYLTSKRSINLKFLFFDIGNIFNSLIISLFFICLINCLIVLEIQSLELSSLKQGNFSSFFSSLSFSCYSFNFFSFFLFYLLTKSSTFISLYSE